MHPKRLTLLLATAVLTFASAGCATVGTMQTANTLGKGKFQLGLEPSAYGAVGNPTIIVPNVTLSARYGVSNSTDIGARIGSNGFELNAKFMFTKPKKPGLVISLAPAVGGFAFGGGGAAAGALYLQVPVLLGFPLGGGSQFIIGPKVLDWYYFASGTATSGGATSSAGASGNMLALGSSFGVSLKLGSSFRLLPEVALAYPVIAAASAGANGTSASASAIGGSQGVLLQVSLSLLFGG